MMDRFKLEEQILDCWHICDDIQTIIESTDIKELSEDELLNVLIGLKTLYQIKFELMFKTFERMIQNGEITGFSGCKHGN